MPLRILFRRPDQAAVSAATGPRSRRSHSNTVAPRVPMPHRPEPAAPAPDFAEQDHPPESDRADRDRAPEATHETGPRVEADPGPPPPMELAARVTANLAAASGVRRLILEPLVHWSFRAGQVAELVAEPGTEGYFAIASAPIELPRLSFLIKAGGSASEPLMALAEGRALTIRGPYGRGFDIPSVPRSPLVFIAAGTAIAAARSGLLHALGDVEVVPPGSLALVVGVRHEADLCFADELLALARRGVVIRVAVSRPEAPLTAPHLRHGRVHDHLADLVTPATLAFLAGSDAFEDDVEAALGTLGVGHAQIQRNYRPDHRSNPA